MGQIPMNFWGSGSSTSMSVRDFLAFRNGQCGAWARFFQDLLELHGIFGNRIEITYKTNQYLPSQFITPLHDKIQQFFGSASSKIEGSETPRGILLIKNWTVSIDGFHLLKSDQSLPPYIVSHVDEVGVTAQGLENTNPQSWFSDHIVVEFGSKYYDPSYGKSYLSKDDWEQNSLDGLGAILVYKDYDVIPNLVVPLIWISEKPINSSIQTDFHTDPN